MNKLFEKETFKKEVKENVKRLFRRTLDEATPQQIFQAVSYAVKDVIMDDWIADPAVSIKRGCKNCLLYVYGVFDGSCPGQQPDQSDRHIRK